MFRGFDHQIGFTAKNSLLKRGRNEVAFFLIKCINSFCCKAETVQSLPKKEKKSNMQQQLHLPWGHPARQDGQRCYSWS